MKVSAESSFPLIACEQFGQCWLAESDPMHGPVAKFRNCAGMTSHSVIIAGKHLLLN